MDVSALKLNESVSRGVNTLQAKKKATSFSGATKVATDIAEISKGLPVFHKTLLSAEKLKGEFINAIITAVGTACVAPIFITYNPFSKEDKETRKYSAWRQPISAVIQFIATLAILKPFDKYMNKHASLGDFKDADLRSNPVESYVKAKIKKEHPDYDTVQLNKAVNEFKAKAFNDAVETAKDQYKGQTIQDDALLSKASLDKTLQELKDDKTKPLKGLSKDTIHERVKAKTLESIRKNIDDTAKEINTIISGNEGKTAGSILTELETELGEIITFIKENKDPASEELKAVLKEKSARKSILETVISQFENLGQDANLNTIKKEFGENLDQITHNLKVRQVVKASSENAKHVFERLKLWSGMGVALLVLPIACCTLNYVYPRLMEIIMPEIAQKRKMKQQGQQPQTSEIRKEVKA